MKKAIVMGLVVGLFFACNPGTNTTEKTGSITQGENHDTHGKKAGGLALNNGLKWKADSSTRANVALLQKVVSNAKQQSLENYHQTAAELQDGLNKMVKECRMKGPEHDALHKWLEPLMETTNDLKKQTTMESAATSLHQIEQQLSLFFQYFE